MKTIEGDSNSPSAESHIGEDFHTFQGPEEGGELEY